MQGKTPRVESHYQPHGVCYMAKLFESLEFINVKKIRMVVDLPLKAPVIGVGLRRRMVAIEHSAACFFPAVFDKITEVH
jgi:hypothetical protein